MHLQRCAFCRPAFIIPALNRSMIPTIGRPRFPPLISSPTRAYIARTHRVQMSASPPSESNSTQPPSDDELSNEDSSSSDPSSFQMELLRRRMNDLQTRLTNGHMPTDRVIDIGATMHDEITEEDASDDMIQNFVNLHSVWTIIFTNAVDGSEGVYSLAIGSENVILAFEDRQEAQRYALCLEAQTFPSPKISELETSELCDFCTDSGSRLGFVPAGSLITPPDESAVEDLDKWRGKSSGNDTGMSQEDIENMKKRLDSLFGQ